MKGNRSKFNTLRTLLFSKGIDHKYLAQKMGRSDTYFGDRINGKKAFTLADVYTICKILQLPLESIPEYFPERDTPKKAG